MIPARYAATRFPAKLMQVLGGKPVISHTYHNTVATGLFDEVWVVTDSDIIYNEITSRVELFTAASQLQSLVTAYEKDGEKGYSQRLSIVKEILSDFYKENNTAVDKKLFEVLMAMYTMDQEKQKKQALQNLNAIIKI